MTKTNQTIQIYRGDTAAVSITLTHADGSPYDPVVEDAVPEWRMARTAFSPADEALVQKVVGAGLDLPPAGGGVVTLTLTRADTDFEPGVYYHELKVFDGDDVYTFLTGAFVIKQALQMGSKALRPATGTMALTASGPVAIQLI